MTTWLRNCLSTAMLVAPFVLVGDASAQEQRRGPRTLADYDRRATLQLQGSPRQPQLRAIAALREELDGSLLETYDSTSGVTRSLFNPVGKLTPPNPGDPVDIAIGFARDHVDLLGLELGDLDEMRVCDVVDSRVSGATHVYLCQVYKGVDVFNAQLHVNVSRDGSILSVNNSFVPNVNRGGKSRTASIEATDACMAAAKHLGIRAESVSRMGERRLRAEDLSTEPIEAELVWMPVGRNVKLAWRFQLHTPDGQHVYDMTVDAEPGYGPRSRNRVWTRFDRVSPGLYEVYPVPIESPSHAPIPDPDDGRSVVVSPEDPVASPLGWHDDGSQSYSIMRGNNVHAYDDRDANDLPPAVQPDCGPDLECSFPLDLTTDPSNYTSAAVANLFYWTNVVHDVQYLYGFDEAAGNFQVDNFGRGGLGGDHVRAEAQDGSGVDNANFTATVDGEPPKIQMYLWDFTFPLRDGDLDAGIVVHEYGHGISTRLVGGPSTISCLANSQQPGEGLSDWWSLVYTARPGDEGADPRGIGTYVLGSPPGGLGIRTQAYSTDPAVNTHTYESIAGMAIPHGVGEVWAQAAWEAYWLLVNLHGFDPNLYDPQGGAGNQRMMLYVNEGLKNTACSPTFTDVRDGIIQAAIDNYNGEDVCFLWEAFANFGLGEDAISGGPWSTTPVNGFQVPASCLAGPRITSPAPLGVLDGSTVTFEWTADGEIVDEWALDIGTGRGASDIYTSGSLPGTTFSHTVTGLPVDGSQVFVRLHYLIGTEWGFRDALYTADLATPEITSPVPGTTLSASSVTFAWDAMGLPVESWTLDIGSAPGNSNFYTSGTLTGDVTSIDATGIPTDGRTIYVRLQYYFDGEWKFEDFTYTAVDLVPSLVSPVPGSTLAGSDVTFSWDSNGALVDDWMLYVGSSTGSSDLFNSGSLGAGATSVSVSGLPTDGRTLYVRLRYAFNAVWSTVDYVYTAAVLAPELLSPAPNTVLPGSTVSFTWTANGSPVQNWILEVGSGPGLSDYFYSGTLASDVLSATATGVPTDSRPIYVRLRYLLNGAWSSLSYEYTAADLVPELVSPAPGSVLPSDEVTFTWTANGSQVNNWTLGVGTSAGLSDIYYSGTLASDVTSAHVTGLPRNSSTVYARLRYLANGAWSTLDYVFTSAAPPPVMTSPPPGSELSETTVIFTWDDNGNAATAWRLQVGSALGAADVYDSGSLAATARSHEVSGLPSDGRELFVRLSYDLSGVPGFADFGYTAPLMEPAMVSPAPGSVLNGTEVTFTWSANGAPVTGWRLLVGSSAGAGDYEDSGALAETVLARTVSNLPTDGSTVHVRLEFTLGGETGFEDYLYTSGPGVPEILTPTPGSILPGPEATFTWTANDSPVVWWLFYVGTSPGSSNIYYSGYLSPDVTSAEVSDIPTDSRTIYVRLRFLLDGRWQSIDYQYTAADIQPELSTPVPGATFSGSDVTFSWTSNGSAVKYWILYVGTSPGYSNLYYSGTLAADVLSANVTGLPTDSRTIYVRLRYLLSGSWQYTDYQYTAADLSPELLEPVPGSVLPGPDVTFTWTSNGAPVTRWILDVGTSPGSSNLYYSGTLLSDELSRTVTGLPTDGRTIYVRLRYLLSGSWQSTIYEVTAASSP